MDDMGKQCLQCPLHLEIHVGEFLPLVRSDPLPWTFTNPERECAFENIVGKEENVGNQHFLRLPQCFSTILKMISCIRALTLYQMAKF